MEDIAELKGNIIILQNKLDALIDILQKEGLTSHDEVEVGLKDRLGENR